MTILSLQILSNYNSYLQSGAQQFKLNNLLQNYMIAGNNTVFIHLCETFNNYNLDEHCLETKQLAGQACTGEGGEPLVRRRQLTGVNVAILPMDRRRDHFLTKQFVIKSTFPPLNVDIFTVVIIYKIIVSEYRWSLLLELSNVSPSSVDAIIAESFNICYFDKH